MTRTLTLPRLSAAAIGFLVLLRLLSGLVAPQVEILRVPRLQIDRQGNIFRIPAGAGSAPRPAVTQRPTQTLPNIGSVLPSTLAPSQSVTAAPTLPEKPLRPQFTAADRLLVRLDTDTGCPYKPDIGSLLKKTLDIELSGQAPTVLIVHTHASECYTKEPGQSFSYSGNYRTLDTSYNMVAVGEALAAELEKAGIRVLHDTTLHDYPSYSESYSRCRKTVKQYLQAYPSIQLVLDLHRDAATNADGSQYATGVRVDGERIAQFMFVSGSNRVSTHPHWQENLALALKMQALLERDLPGLTRKTLLRNSRFNQDLSTGALLIECGTAGNTLTEVLGAVPYLARAILALMHGAN